MDLGPNIDTPRIGNQFLVTLTRDVDGVAREQLLNPVGRGSPEVKDSLKEIPFINKKKTLSFGDAGCL